MIKVFNLAQILHGHCNVCIYLTTWSGYGLPWLIWHGFFVSQLWYKEKLPPNKLSTAGLDWWCKNWQPFFFYQTDRLRLNRCFILCVCMCVCVCVCELVRVCVCVWFMYVRKNRNAKPTGQVSWDLPCIKFKPLKKEIQKESCTFPFSVCWTYFQPAELKKYSC